MAQSGAEPPQEHPLGAQTIGAQKPAPQQAAEGGFDAVNQDDQQRSGFAVVPEKVGKARVSAAVAADIILFHQPGQQNRPVEIAQKIGKEGG